MTNFTLPLISSQLVETDAILKPLPCSWLRFLRTRRRGPWPLMVILVWLQELWWMVSSLGSHGTERSLETGQLFYSRREITLKQVEAKKGAGGRSSNWVFTMCKVLEGNLHIGRKCINILICISLLPQPFDHLDLPRFVPPPLLPVNIHTFWREKFPPRFSGLLIEWGECVVRIKEPRYKGKAGGFRPKD